MEYEDSWTPGLFVLFCSCALASAGGIGGGGISLPVLLVIFGLEYKTAVPLSLCTVLGNNVSQFFVNWNKRHPVNDRRQLAYWDAVLVLLPAQLGGSTLGVVILPIFPELMLLAVELVVLLYAAVKSLWKGRKLWIIEDALKKQQQQNGNGIPDELGPKSLEMRPSEEFGSAHRASLSTTSNAIHTSTINNNTQKSSLSSSLLNSSSISDSACVHLSHANGNTLTHRSPSPSPSPSVSGSFSSVNSALSAAATTTTLAGGRKGGRGRTHGTFSERSSGRRNGKQQNNNNNDNCSSNSSSREVSMYSTHNVHPWEGSGCLSLQLAEAYEHEALPPLMHPQMFRLPLPHSPHPHPHASTTSSSTPRKHRRHSDPHRTHSAGSAHLSNPALLLSLQEKELATNRSSERLDKNASTEELEKIAQFAEEFEGNQQETNGEKGNSAVGLSLYNDTSASGYSHSPEAQENVPVAPLTHQQQQEQSEQPERSSTVSNGSPAEQLLPLPELLPPIDYPVFTFQVLAIVWLCYAFVYIVNTLAVPDCSPAYYSIIGAIYPPLTVLTFWAVLHVAAKQTRGEKEYMDYLAARQQHSSTQQGELENGERAGEKTDYESSRADDKGIIPYFLEGDIDFKSSPARAFTPPILTFIVGILCALLGIGGGELMGPLLLSLNVIPQVSSSTTPVLSLLTSSSTVLHYAILGEIPYPIAGLVFLVGFLGGYTGRVSGLYISAMLGRYSILVFSLAGVLFVSVALVIYHLTGDAGSDFSFHPVCDRD